MRRPKCTCGSKMVSLGLLHGRTVLGFFCKECHNYYLYPEISKGKLLKKVDLIAKDEVPSGGLITRSIHMAILSFILPPYWGCLILLLLLLLMFITRMIKKKAR